MILFLDFDGVLHPFFPRNDRSDAENQFFSYLRKRPFMAVWQVV